LLTVMNGKRLKERGKENKRGTRQIRIRAAESRSLAGRIDVKLVAQRASLSARESWAR
jgi:hypothetical protein